MCQKKQTITKFCFKGTAQIVEIALVKKKKPAWSKKHKLSDKVIVGTVESTILSCLSQEQRELWRLEPHLMGHACAIAYKQ